MPGTKLFDGVYPQELTRMKHCLSVSEKFFEPEERIMSYTAGDTRLGVLTKGQAQLLRYEPNGHLMLIRTYEPGEPFGSIFVYGMRDGLVEMTAKSRCQVMFFTYDNLMHRCENACRCHTRLIDNLIRILAEDAGELRSHLAILSCRSTRQKLIAYFRMLAAEQGSTLITLPMSHAALADYLMIDRSAMHRELKKMREDGIISASGSGSVRNRIRLMLKDEEN